MAELKLCPFCGGEARIRQMHDESLWSHDQVLKTSVVCDGCDVGTGYTEEGQDPEAIELWNTRAAPADAPVAEPVAPRPFPDRGIRDESAMTAWQSGAAKPTIEGEYLREFDEGVAFSEWHGGKWLRDGFFESDIQDAAWRGLIAAPEEAQLDEPAIWVHTGDLEQIIKTRTRGVIGWPDAGSEGDRTPLYTRPPAPEDAKDAALLDKLEMAVHFDVGSIRIGVRHFPSAPSRFVIENAEGSELGDAFTVRDALDAALSQGGGA